MPKIIDKAFGYEISYPCIELKTICGAGSKGAGGLCDCTKLDGWTKGKWEKPICSQGECRARQKQYKFCKGSSYKHPNGKPLSDGTWCRNGHFFSKCLTTAGIITLKLFAEIEYRFFKIAYVNWWEL